MAVDSTASSSQTPKQAPRAPRRLFWQPAAMMILCGALIVAAFRLSSFDPAVKNLATMSATGLVLLLLFAWFVLFSGAAKWVRQTVFVLVALVAAGFFTLLRVEGPAGDFSYIDFTWRFADKPDVRLASAAPNLPALGAAAVADLTHVAKHDFPQFLGPDRNCVVSDVGLARDWSAHPPRERWRVPIGAGWSGFSIIGGYALTQEQRGDEELVVCYDLRDGTMIWVHRDQARYDSVVGGDGPRATPTIDGGRVYTMGATGIVNCLDGATGRRIWSHDVVEEYDVVDASGQPFLEWGKSCSPLVVDDLVVVDVGGANGKSVVAFDRETGEERWRAGDDQSSYASPIVATLAGKRQIIMINATSVTAHDPATGEILWNYAWPPTEERAAQPIVIDNARLLIAAGYGIGCMLLEVAQNDDAAFAVKPLWERFSLNLKPKFTNVALKDGYIYGLDDGILTCFDVADNRRMWKRGRYGHGQLLLAGDLLIVTSESGDVVLVEATPDEHRELGRITAFADKTWNSPALAGSLLLVRNNKEAACFELPAVNRRSASR